MDGAGHADVGGEFGGGFGAYPANQGGEIQQRGIVRPRGVHGSKAVHDFLISRSILFVHKARHVGFDHGTGDGVSAAVGAIGNLQIGRASCRERV